MTIKIRVTTVELSHKRQLKSLLALAKAPASAAAGAPASAAAGLAALITQLDATTEGRAESGDALFAAVCSPQTAPARLRDLKELAKSLVPKARTPARRSASMLLYHAAVASALVHHGQQISSLGRGARRELYRGLAEGLDGVPLGRLFARAAERLLDEELSGKRDAAA